MDSLQPDHDMPVFPRRTEEERDALRTLALSDVALSYELARQPSEDTKPIRSPFAKESTPPRASPAERESLRKFSKENRHDSDREPLVMRLPAGFAERLLPAVSGSLRLRGLDADEDDRSNEFTITIRDMVWDTGSHWCSITSDLLPESFNRYLEMEENDPYRGPSGVDVQVDAYACLSNTPFFFNTVFKVVPRSAVPNRRSGVLLGQNGFMDRMVSTNVPRVILQHRGEEVEENLWGEINISEFVSINGEFHSF